MNAKVVMFEIFKSTWLHKRYRLNELMLVNSAHKGELSKRPVNVARQVATTSISWSINYTINLIYLNNTLSKNIFTNGITERCYLTVVCNIYIFFAMSLKAAHTKDITILHRISYAKHTNNSYFSVKQPITHRIVRIATYQSHTKVSEISYEKHIYKV